MSRLALALLVACWSVGMASIRAQATVLGGPDTGCAVTVTVEETPAAVRPGGYGWVTVTLQNNDVAPHRIEISAGDAYRMDRDGISARCECRLEAGAVRVEQLPIATSSSTRQTQILVVEDDDRRRSSRHVFSTPRPAGSSVLFVTDADSGNPAAALKTVLDRIAPPPQLTEQQRRRLRGRSAKPLSNFHVVARSPRQIPTDWRWITGFDLLVVDGRAGLADAQEQAIARYVEAGGAALLLASDRLPPAGALRTLCGSGTAVDSGTATRCGFGQIMATTAAGAEDGVAAPGVEEWLLRSSASPLDPSARWSSGSVPARFSAWDVVPGVGDPPVGIYFLLLLLFAVVAGPFNYFYWWRQRRLPMLLLTVPAAGLAVTLAILGFGLFKDGLGIQGVVTSATVLDQREHRAATWAERKLYAGLTPAALQPRPATWLLPDLRRRSTHYNRYGRGREMEPFVIDSLTGEVGGEAIAARTVTGLRSASVGIERARVRFRARDDGGFDALVGEEFGIGPSKNGISVVFVDFDGRAYSGDESGTLRPFQDLATAGEQFRRAMKSGSGTSSGEAGFWPTSVEPPPGSYMAFTMRNPCVDELGLDVHWRRSRHLIIGHLAEEDVLRD